jgi:HemK-related putative methylase
LLNAGARSGLTGSVPVDAEEGAMDWMAVGVGPAHPVRVNPLLRQGTRLCLLLKRPLLLRRVRRTVVERVDGVVVVVSPEVLNPVVFRSGAYLARTVASAPAAAPPPSGSAEPRALDMGTGSGIGAMFAARRGYRVVAVDLNPEAVRCARANALLNRLEDRVEVRHGDLFGPVGDERFDLVLFNPPFFRGRPRNLFDLAWRGEDVLERFAAGLPGRLRPGGTALVLLSTDGDAAGMLRALSAQGLSVEAIASRHFGNEIMTVYSARLSGPPGRGEAGGATP